MVFSFTTPETNSGNQLVGRKRRAKRKLSKVVKSQIALKMWFDLRSKAGLLTRIRYDDFFLPAFNCIGKTECIFR